MTGRRSIALAGAGLVAVAWMMWPAPDAACDVPVPDGEWSPLGYVCYRAAAPITIDGKLDEAEWSGAPWTSDFVDIRGDLGPTPRFRTRAKMLWDDTYFYVAAEMEEPHVWGTLRERDSVIFHDNDFEVFIDPDGDTHDYYELEVNALGTEWDLLLTKPYRDSGTAIDSWDIQGLLTGILVIGTLNDPSDTDRGWSIEIAMPWAVLEECARKPAPPEEGDVWRVNYSRVEWQAEIQDGAYVKLADPETGRPLPEDNWVWSPQGLVNMHYPEMWGFVRFSTAEAAPEVPVLAEADWLGPAEWALRLLYYRERAHFADEGSFTANAAELGLEDAVAGLPTSWPAEIAVTPSMFEARVFARDGTTLHISHDGRLWRTTRPAGRGEENR
jgi:hypothetical protein